MNLYPGPKLCFKCKHFQDYRVTNDGAIPICAAFPNKIPDKIFFEGRDHTKPYPGDHGIQFEPIETKV